MKPSHNQRPNFAPCPGLSLEGPFNLGYKKTQIIAYLPSAEHQLFTIKLLWRLIGWYRSPMSTEIHKKLFSQILKEVNRKYKPEFSTQ
jgi:hypothetical protein